MPSILNASNFKYALNWENIFDFAFIYNASAIEFLVIPVFFSRNLLWLHIINDYTNNYFWMSNRYLVISLILEDYGVVFFYIIYN